MKRKANRADSILAVVFAALSIGLAIRMARDPGFFDWAFARHQNMLSWYIRPLFLIPFCLAAYKRSWAGIAATVFFLLTSMFWFPTPDTVGEQAKAFLQMEKEYLTGLWTPPKILLSLLVPASLAALGAALWKRSLWLGISVLIFIAVAKLLWSAAFGGEAGLSILAPAVVGLGICILCIGIGFRKLENRRKKGS